MKLGFAVALVTLIFDQLSKYWILFIYDLPAKGSVEILPFFSLTMVWNRGVSFGLFEAGSEVGRWLLIIITLAISALVVRWLVKAHNWRARLGFGLVLGGALGNVIDRFVHKAVVDFLHFYYESYSFYVFNIADSAITVGVVILLLDAILTSLKDSRAPADAADNG